jgi:hypothetical protein
VLSEGKRVERKRGEGGFIGAALVAIQGVGNARGSNSGDVTGRGRERSVMTVMTGGVHLSVRRGVSWGTGSGLKKMGRGLASGVGLKFVPGVQIVFISSIFLFLFLENSD